MFIFMQIKKEEIRQRILEIACDEFIINGFRNASLRVIAGKSSIALANIYNYFKNKDELFTEVVQPVLDAINDLLTKHNNDEKLTTEYFYSAEQQHRELVRMVDMIEKHREGLSLLLFKSAGSSQENFREQLTRKSMSMGQEYLVKMKEKYPEISIDVSPFFLHFMSSMWLNIMSEIVVHTLTHEQITKFFSEYIKFGTAGWRELMKTE
ncbi:MAG: TetR family transcriptional regulator [Bacteroidetes bacterium]|nr:TetR family transcriptional regulator [Bacteroidota bacterium]